MIGVYSQLLRSYERIFTPSIQPIVFALPLQANPNFNNTTSDKNVKIFCTFHYREIAVSAQEVLNKWIDSVILQQNETFQHFRLYNCVVFASLRHSVQTELFYADQVHKK